MRSAQSSRASTARLHLRPSVSPEFKTEQKMPSHFKFLFERQQSAGGSSQSSGAKVIELSTPEGEEEENVCLKESRRRLRRK